MSSTDPPTTIRVRTPHLSALTAALEARDHVFEVLEPDVLNVNGLAADDLGWLAAGAGVVIYEMVPDG